MKAYDALILAGGRSNRMGGINKAGLTDGRSTLLEQALVATRGATRTLIVGGQAPRSAIVSATTGTLMHTVEEPRYAGPAYAIAWGLKYLRVDCSEFTCVLSCDLPSAPDIVAALCQVDFDGDGVCVCAHERMQPLMGLYRTAALHTVFAHARPHDPLHSHVSALRLDTLKLPDRLASDIDTPAEAATFGYFATSASTGTSGLSERLESEPAQRAGLQENLEA